MDNSRAFGVSIRAWIALFVVYTVCLLSLWGIDVQEPLYTLAGMVVAFYFGQEKGKQLQMGDVQLRVEKTEKPV